MEFEEFGTPPLDEQEMRLESEIIKMRLHAEYGAVFPEAEVTGLPAPDLEYNFLKRVLQLHQRIANTPPRPLREVIDFRPLALFEEILDDVDLMIALEEALDYLEEQNVIVEFGREYPDRVMYEFVLNELPDLEVIGRPADDEYICVLYEAFHPNPEEEIEAFCEDFLRALFGLQLQEEFSLFFSKAVPLVKLFRTRNEDVLRLTERFLGYFPPITGWYLEFDEVEGRIGATKYDFGDGSGLTRGTIHYSVELEDGSFDTISGPFRFMLQRHEGLWQMRHFDFHGFSWEQGPAE
jgi:hypothetical protein